MDGVISGCNKHCAPNIMLRLDFVSFSVVYSHVRGNASILLTVVFVLLFFFLQNTGVEIFMPCGKMARYTLNARFFKETDEKGYMSLFVCKRYSVLSVAHVCVLLSVPLSSHLSCTQVCECEGAGSAGRLLCGQDHSEAADLI